MKGHSRVPAYFLLIIALSAGFVLADPPSLSQQDQEKAAPEITKKSAAAGRPEKAEQPEKAAHPAQIELLETKVRFETNGDSRKEVHTRAKIHRELGVREFAQLNFDFNRSFESVEIPMVHITHASGGTADILPSAVTDRQNPAVVNAPAYQDVRVKSVRILGLQPGDTLEYRVVRTVSHHPLAPDFWVEHSFDRSGVVTREIFELDLPSTRKPMIRINPATPALTQESGQSDAARSIYRWERVARGISTESQNQANEPEKAEPDVSVSTLSWELLSVRLDENLTPGSKPLENIGRYEESVRELSRKPVISSEVAAKADELTKGIDANLGKLEAIYNFVSQQIATIDLPLGVTGFAARPVKDVLLSGYAIPEDKFVLFAALARAAKLEARAALTGSCDKEGIPRPSVFKHLLISATEADSTFWLDPSLEVAPFGMISSIPQKCAFVLNRAFFAMNSAGHEWQPLERKLPFAARQSVEVDSSLGENGALRAKVHYSMRGDNELVLRVAFHHTPKERWKEVAQLLSITDGFRGQVTDVTASDPYLTKEPFTVEYELEQPKFVDWSRKPVRIPALLPQFGLPDSPPKPLSGSATAPIELGTPLEVETKMTLHLPPGTSASAPAGTAVERDYAAYASQYTVNGSTLTATRRIKFVLRELPAARAADYNAFLRVVQSDEAQDFTLEREGTPQPSSKP